MRHRRIGLAIFSILDYYNKTAQIIGYAGKDEHVVFPSEIDGCKVISIKSERHAFPAGHHREYETIILNNTARLNMKSLVIPDTVEEIGMHAFVNCTNLKEVTLSKNLKVIGGDAFGNCTSLEKISFPASLEKISTSQRDGKGQGAFQNCTSLKEIYFDPKCKLDYLPYNAFRSCTSLEKVTFSDNIQNIYEDVFRDCVSLTSVKLPAYLKSISSNVFKGCTNLSEVKWNDKLETIGGRAFSETALTKLELPSTVKWIGDGAFEKCEQLSSVTWNNSLEYLGSRAFMNTNLDLKTIKLNEGLTEFGNEVFGNIGLTSIIIPSTVQKVGTFKNYPNLQKVIFLGVPRSLNFDSGTRITLYGFKDSYVEEYARNRGLGFTALKEITDFKVTHSDYKYAKLTWKAVKGIDEYTVYRSTSADGTYKKIATVSKNSYNDKSIKAGKTYYYYVTFKYKDNDGLLIDSVKSETVPVKIVPNDVAKFSGEYYYKNYNSRGVKFSWDKVNNADGYVLYYRNNFLDDWKKITTIKSNKTTSYNYKTADGFVVKQFAIRAYKTINGKNVYSDYAIVTITP